jgi:hypothetical protein
MPMFGVVPITAPYLPAIGVWAVRVGLGVALAFVLGVTLVFALGCFRAIIIKLIVMFIF